MHPDKDNICMCRNRPSINKDTPVNLQQLKGYTLYNCGLEIEGANWGGIAARDGGQFLLGGVPGGFVHDGSVTSGLEWVSQPIVARRTKLQPGLFSSLLAIADDLEAQQVQYDATCGYHVHIDQRGLSHYELAKLLANYIQIQPLVYQMAHPNREALNQRRNRYYCNRYQPQLGNLLRSLLRTGSQSAIKEWMYDQFFAVSTDALRDGVKRRKRYHARLGTSDQYVRWNGNAPSVPTGVAPEDLQRLKKFKYTNNRYYGLNIMCWFNQGTVEWRFQGHPLGTTDIIMWPLVTCAITHKLIYGKILQQPIKTIDEFLTWLNPADELRNYITNKFKQFEKAWTTTTVKPNYQELV